MKNKQALTRYRLIDIRMTMRQKPAPSLEDLIAFVSEKIGAPVSESCIQKDLYAMRYDESLGFNAPIAWDRKARGYVYTEPNYSINAIPVSEEDLQGLEMAIGILEQFKNIPAIKIFEDAIGKLSATVKQSRGQHAPDGILLLDRPKRYLGIEYMSDMVEAIQQRRVLRISYQPFSKNEPKKHTVHPYFIKEYNGRMYLIAKDIHPTKESKMLTFAFDRMSDMVLMHTTFNEEYVDRENYFKSAIGVTLNNSEPEEIILNVNPSQSGYLKSQPIHHSQTILTDTANELTIRLNLVINYELTSLLLSMGDQVQVVKPLSLAQKIKETAEAILNKYQTQ